MKADRVLIFVDNALNVVSAVECQSLEFGTLATDMRHARTGGASGYFLALRRNRPNHEEPECSDELISLGEHLGLVLVERLRWN